MLNAIGGEITSQALNDNFSYLDSQKVGKAYLFFYDVSDYGAVGDGVADDKAAIEAVIAAARPGSVIVATKKYNISGTIIVNKPVHLKGFGQGEFTTTTQNVNYLFDFQTDDWSFEGFKVNMALTGRSGIKALNRKNFRIEDNYFTGYTADYGNYQTDSAIHLGACRNVIIAKNKFIKWADQYAADQYLVRCITIEGETSSSIIVSNNIFESVSQGVINQGADVIVQGNTFKDVKDNGVYALSETNGMVINGNSFSDMKDEAIVFGGSRGIISNNVFKEVANKAIALNKVTDLIINANQIYNLNLSAGAIMRRSTAVGTLDTVTISNNIIDGVYGTEVITLSDIQGLRFTNNNIKVFQNTNYSNILRIGTGSNARISIQSNTLYKYGGTASVVYGIRIDGTTAPNSRVDLNTLVNCQNSITPTDIVVSA